MKFVLFGEKMLISLGRLYEKTHSLQVVSVAMFIYLTPMTLQKVVVVFPSPPAV